MNFRAAQKIDAFDRQMFDLKPSRNRADVVSTGTRIEVNGIVKDVVERTRATRVRLDQAGAGFGSIIASGDPDRLRQAVQNVLGFHHRGRDERRPYRRDDEAGGPPHRLGIGSSL